MRDEMDEAHSRDTRYQNDLRVARMALVELAENTQMNLGLADHVLALAGRLKREEDHIVARWN